MGVSYKGRPVPSVTDSGQGSVVRTRGRIIGFPDPPSYDTLFEPDVINSPGGVFSYSIFFPSYIELDIPPSADAATAPITVLMALTLNYQVLEDEANEWPLEEWMYSTFHEAWIDGLQGRMFSQVSKPWSNTQMAQYHMKRFRKFMGRAKQMAEKGYVFNKPTWRFPQWA